jgi:WD40 repeat protein
MEIRSVSTCIPKDLLVTQSQDTVVLWHCVKDRGIEKVKSLLPTKAGNFYQDARISHCGVYLATLSRDATVQLWNLDSINGKHNDDIP